MSKIQTLINELCPDGVEHTPLGEIGSFTRGGGLQKDDFTVDGVGCIHYGQVYTHYGIWATETKTYVSSVFAAKKRKMAPDDIFIATTSENDEDLGKSVAWLGTEDIVASGDAFVFKHSQDPKYVSYFLNSSLFHKQKQRYITGTKVRRISGDALAKIIMPVPPLEIQRVIVDILDKFTKLEAELEAELEARKKQYRYYRERLLSYGDDFKWFTIGEVLDLKAGKSVKSSDISSVSTPEYSIPCYGGNGVRGFVNEASHHTSLPLIGRQGALCGNVNWAKSNFYATEHAVVVTPKMNINMRWAYHMLDSMDLNQYATKSAQPGLSVSRLNRVLFPVPDIEVQIQTAKILDTFDALINNLSSGLPAEIAARRKQYEYYRDQLLTFKELAS